jgi:hypothetical protein
MLHGESSVSLFEFCFGGVLAYAQHLVVIALGHLDQFLIQTTAQPVLRNEKRAGVGASARAVVQLGAL